VSLIGGATRLEPRPPALLAALAMHSVVFVRRGVPSTVQCSGDKSCPQCPQTPAQTRCLTITKRDTSQRLNCCEPSACYRKVMA